MADRDRRIRANRRAPLFLSGCRNHRQTSRTVKFASLCLRVDFHHGWWNALGYGKSLLAHDVIGFFNFSSHASL